ncbi:hypothetical protein [Mailhella massiliensis]|uniref:hypothetical protein n=1 Tax=Mailhella massiliensis TaxID=1903261 RepID=UPI0023F572D0|nr:hypothetical protein [Mailhella massiliensis]
MGFFDGGLSGVAGAIGGLAGGLLDAGFSSQASAADKAWQKEVMQNQLQWKAADARKAGLHPLAVLGGGAYSGSLSSRPTSWADSLGKLGEGIGDAFAAYKSKEQIAKEAAWLDEQRNMERAEHDARMRESASKVLMNNGLALEATRRAESYTKPWATGREVVPGQVDAPSDRPKAMLQKFRKPDGTLTAWRASNDYKAVYEDTPGLEFRPHLDALYWDLRDLISHGLSW